MNGILQVFSRLIFIFLLLCGVSLGVHRAEKSCATDSVSGKKSLTQFHNSVYDSSYDFVYSSGVSALGTEEPRLTASTKGQIQVLNCSLQSRPKEVRARESLRPIPVFQAIKTFNQLRTYNIQEVQHVTLADVFLTAYSLDVRSTGKTPAAADYGITFSGTRATVGRTVAVDPRIIPIGTPIYIDLKGVGWRIAEDTGGAVKGRHIDILLNSEQAAIQFGVKRHVRVYIPITDPVSVMATSSSRP